MISFLSSAAKCFSFQFQFILFSSKLQNQITQKSFKTTNAGWRRCSRRQKGGGGYLLHPFTKKILGKKSKTRQDKTGQDKMMQNKCGSLT